MLHIHIRKAGDIVEQPVDIAMDNRRLAVAELPPAVNTAEGRTAAGHRPERVAAESIVRLAAGDIVDTPPAVCTARLLAVHTAVQHRPAARLAALQ